MSGVHLCFTELTRGKVEVIPLAFPDDNEELLRFSVHFLSRRGLLVCRPRFFGLSLVCVLHFMNACPRVPFPVAVFMSWDLSRVSVPLNSQHFVMVEIWPQLRSDSWLFS